MWATSSSTYRYTGDYGRAPLAARSAFPSVPADSDNNILRACCSSDPPDTATVCSGQWPPRMCREKREISIDLSAFCFSPFGALLITPADYETRSECSIMHCPRISAAINQLADPQSTANGPCEK